MIVSLNIPWHDKYLVRYTTQKRILTLTYIFFPIYMYEVPISINSQEDLYRIHYT